MLGDKLRGKSKVFTKKIGESLSFLPISANTFSMLAMVWAWMFMLSIIASQKYIAFVFFILAVVWDAIDGGFAKAKKDESKFGYYIEGIIDKWVEIIIYFGVFLIGYKYEIFIFAMASIMLSFAKPRAAMVVYIGEFDWPAVGERVERLVLLGIGIFLYCFGINKWLVFDFPVDLTRLAIYLGIILLLVGNIQRIIFAKKLIERGGIKGMEVKDRLK